MNDVEKSLLNEISSLFNDPMIHHKAELGLAKHEKGDDSNTLETAYNNIDDEFRLEIIDLQFYNSISAAFTKVHGYKYITDRTFDIALEKEMKAMGVPRDEIEKSMKAFRKLRDKQKNNEADNGIVEK